MVSRIVSTRIINAMLNMAPSDQKTEVVTPAEVPQDLPLPSDPKVVFLGGLFVLAVLAAAYVVSEIVLPLVFAIVLKLLAAASPAGIGAVARTANTRGVAAYPRAIWNDRRLGHGYFGPGPYLGSQASGGHSSAWRNG